MSDKLDIKDVLYALDTKNKMYFSGLSEEHKKQLSMWTTMRFMSSVSGNLSAYGLIIANELVNENFNLLSKHPELQWMLLSMCGTGSKQFHSWVQPPRKKAKNKKQTVLSVLYPSLNSTELDLLESITSDDSLTELLESYGYSDKEINEVFK